MSSERQRWWETDAEVAGRLYCAAIAGPEFPALELELNGYCDEDESLEETLELRPGILKTMDDVRRAG